MSGSIEKQFNDALFSVERARLCTLYCSGWLFAVGIIILVLRSIYEPPQNELLAIVASGLVIALIAAFFKAKKSLPSTSKLKAFLDKYNNCGGLFISQTEIALGSWSQKVSDLSYPQPVWDYKKSSCFLCLSLLFTLFAFLLPVSSITSPLEDTLNIDKEVTTLADQIEVLKEEEIISEEDAEKLDESLKQLAEKAQATDPIKTWEALDHIASKTRQKAEEAAEELLRDMEQQSALETMAEVLASPEGQSMESSTLNESMKELAKMMNKSAEQSEKLQNLMSENLMQAIKAGNLSNKDLAAIEQSLAQSQNGMQESITKMIQNKMINPNNAQMAQNARKKSTKKLRDYLKQNCRNGKVCEGMDSCTKPGQGGVDRGRGDADLTFTDPSDLDGFRYKPVILPPGQLTDLRSSMQIAISYTAPDSEGSEDSKSGAMKDAESGGGAGHKQTILPKHKKLLQEYFNRER